MVMKSGWLCLLLVCFSMLVNTGSVQAQVISGQELRDTANNAIRQYTGAEADISVELLGAVRDVEVPDGNLAVSASLPGGVRYNMPTLVYVNIAVDGQSVGRSALRFEVRLYQNVAVAARNIAIHEVLQAEDLRYERLDIGRLPPGFITSIDKAVGLQVANFMRPGAVLTSFSLQKPIIIKRGSTVNIVARCGGLEVSTVGIAMQDGAVSQVIRVQNANSRRFISGKVLDEANVLVTSFNGK
ncbi:MAG: flagellar basal body P-ring formation chaperone FlgA [Pelosinus sp.]|nr:flagellar basal body P-ring formation chaperone FlgA [Pelosinus sp.]